MHKCEQVQPLCISNLSWHTNPEAQTGDRKQTADDLLSRCQIPWVIPLILQVLHMRCLDMSIFSLDWFQGKFTGHFHI